MSVACTAEAADNAWLQGKDWQVSGWFAAKTNKCLTLLQRLTNVTFLLKPKSKMTLLQRTGFLTCVQNNWETDWSLYLALIQSLWLTGLKVPTKWQKFCKEQQMSDFKIQQVSDFAVNTNHFLTFLQRHFSPDVTPSSWLGSKHQLTN